MSAAQALTAESEPELLRALELHLPGIALVDRELEILRGAQAGRAAALVGRASGGWLVLIEALEGPAGPAALRALGLCALLREHAQELLRRYDCVRGPALVLLAAEGASEIGALLAPLLSDELQLYAWTAIRSRAGERFGLAPVSAARARLAPPTRADFLAGLDASAHALAEELWQRLEAPALAARAEIGGAAVRWSDARGPLCSFARAGAALSGRLAGLDEPLALSSEADGRAFLDAVLALHLQRAGEDLKAPSQGSRNAAFDPREPILSQAEIAAFHD